MMTKLTLLAGFGAGYVLGAKAGTERYDQIARFAAGLQSKPQVQQAQQRLHDTAGDLHDKTVDLVNEQVDRVTHGSATP